MRIIIPLLLFLCSNVYAQDFNRALDNTCVITVTSIENVIENNVKINKVATIQATGCVFKEDDTYYYVLTCGHYFETTMGYKLLFTQNGETKIVRASQYCQLDEIKQDDDADYKDYAVLYFYKKAAEQVNLKINPIPLCLDNPDVNEYFYSAYRVGDDNVCPRTALSKFKIVKFNENEMFITPYPFAGTSGSPVFDKDMSKIYGIHISSGGLCTRSTFIARHYEQSFGKSITQN